MLACLAAKSTKSIVLSRYLRTNKSVCCCCYLRSYDKKPIKNGLLKRNAYFSGPLG
jgi:hypothetical protein